MNFSKHRICVSDKCVTSSNSRWRSKSFKNVTADGRCHEFSILKAMTCNWRMLCPYPAEQDMDRTISYPHYTLVLNLQDIQFPMTLKDITKFERLNKVSVNVYIIEGQKTLDILPIRLTDDKKKKHVNLLYVQDPRDGPFCVDKKFISARARNWTNTRTKNIFAIDKYAINRSKIFVLKIKIKNKKFVLQIFALF